MKYVMLVVSCALLCGCGGGGGGGGAIQDPSDNARLASLVVDTATLTPDFSPDVLNYTTEVPNSTDTVTVTPTTQDATATVTVDGTAVASGTPSQPVTLAVGDTTITTAVTAADGTQLTYLIVATRLEPSTNADLASLVLAVAPLDQVFDPGLLSYTATAGFFGSSTEVAASPDEPNATLTLAGEPLPAATPSAAQLLAEGDTDVAVEVTAQDNVTMQTYTVTTTRLALNTAQQEAYIKASNPDPDNFGTSVAAMGDRLIVGTPFEDSAATGIDGDQDNNAFINPGAAYFFDRTGTSWTQAAYVKASNSNPLDLFGTAVAVYQDVVAVGATGEQSLATGIDGDETDNRGADVGAVYLFAQDEAGFWAQTNYVKASNANSNDRFGGAVALENDLLLVGASFEQSRATEIDGDQDNNSLTEAGAAYLFARDTDLLWRQIAYIKAPNTASGDQFGRAVDLSDRDLAISASLEDSSATGIDGDQDDNSRVDSGAVYLFAVDDDDVLEQTTYMKASNTRGGDEFGTALSIDGNILAVGAPGEDSGSAGINGDETDSSRVDSGAVYIFERDADDVWSQTAYVKASNPTQSDRFGVALSVQGNLLVVGATGEASASTGINGEQLNNSAPNTGAAYVFERDATGDWLQIAYVKASNSNREDLFGAALAIARDSLVISAPGEQSRSAGINGDESDNSLNGAGAVYVIR